MFQVVFPKKLSYVLLSILPFLLAACGSPSSPMAGTSLPEEDQIKTVVAGQLTQSAQQRSTDAAATLQALPTRTPTPSKPTITPSPTTTPLPTPTPTPNTGLVKGKICAPPEGEVALVLYFEEVGNGTVVEVNAEAGQDDYEIDLAPGEYRLYAWLSDFSRGGLYSVAVPCGLGSSCKDHSPLPFTVQLGSELTQIDLCDWRAGPFNVPYPPNKSTEDMTGDIAGAIQYPSSPPSLTVVVTNVNTRNWYYVITNPGWTTFRFDDLPPGSYYAVAYPGEGAPGAYANSAHQLITFKVEAGKTINVTVNDWTAPAGTFPASPVR